MRCAICDAALGEVHYNSDHEDFDPCFTCQEVIDDTLASYEDRPSVSEDELGHEDYAFQYSLLLADDSPDEENT